MSKLWIGNLPEAGDDELDDFLQKYGFPPFDSIERFVGDGSRPAAIVQYSSLSEEVLRRLQERVQGQVWRERKLFVSTGLPERK
jgi:hypothetical protein